MNQTERLKKILKDAENGRFDPQSDHTVEEAQKRADSRDRELGAYRDFYNDVKQHGGVKENAFSSEDW